MGQLADALRGNLRTLAQADARLLRELDQVLPADELDGLSLKQLKQRCRQQGLKGTSNLRKPELIARLRAAAGQGSAAAATALPGSKPSSGPAPAASASPELAAVQARLDRLEALLLRIAEHLGVG